MKNLPLIQILLVLAGLGQLALAIGICNLLAGTFRAVGFDCKSLFRAPLKSQSLAEFWGRRWNLAFSEMTSVAIYRPLSTKVGRNVALSKFLDSSVRTLPTLGAATELRVVEA